MTPEAKVKAAVCKRLDAFGAYYFKPTTGGYGVSGLFDIVAVVHGRFIGIETKATCKQQPTGLQSRNAKLARTAGAATLLIHEGNIDKLESLLRRVINDESTRIDRESVWPVDRD